jgi:ATP-binding cassette, subfamily B, bacterial
MDLRSSDTGAAIRLRSAIPGRERWEVDVIWRRPQLARRIDASLRSNPSFSEVEANPMTGRLLVIFSLTSLPDGPGPLIQRTVEQELEKLGAEADTETLTTRNPIYRVMQRTGAREFLTINAPFWSIMATAASFVSAWSLSKLLGTASGAANQQLAGGAAASLTSRLSLLGLFAGAVTVGEIGLMHHYRKLWRQIASATEHRVRTETFAHVLSLDLAFFDEQSTAKLLNIISQDSANLGRFIESGPGIAIQVAGTSIMVALVLLAISPGLALTVLLPTAVVFLTSRFFQKSIAPLYDQAGEHSGRLSQLLANSLDGATTVKSFTAEDHEIGRVERESEAARLAFDVSGGASQTYGSALHGISAAVVIATLTSASISVAKRTMTESSFILLLQLVPRLMASIGETNRIFDLYRSAVSSAERLMEVFDTVSQIKSGSLGLGANEVKGAIRFERLHFGYQSGLEILRDLDLQVDHGDTIGIVGSTGAGKTTILKLLLRFYDRRSGDLTIDGRDIDDVRIADLRKSIGYVSQDVYLFGGTIYENIVYGRPEASRHEVIEAAKASAAHDFILRLPLGYETVIGERGQKLSAGQRQRVSIARAVLKNAPILILDEATASVDNETEAAIQRSIQNVALGRTVIIIAHRLSTVRNAKRIYVIDAGRVLETGTHQELLEMDGLYASLWRVQTGSQSDTAQSW